MDKKIIRNKMLKKRKELSNEFVLQKSMNIYEKLQCLEVFQHSLVIMYYYSIFNEVDTRYMIEKSLEGGKKVILPKIENISEDEKMIVPYEIKNLDKDIIRGFYNIPEPDSTKCEQIELKKIDLVIIPGVAFDKKNERLGYGGGFYDKFLKLLRPDCTKIALAYDFQIINELISEDHDVKMDEIIFD